DLTDSFWHLAAEILQHRHRDFVRESQVELPGGEGQHRGRAARNNRVLDGVEIGFTGLPVVGIANKLYRLVRFELGEFKGSGTDRVLPHLGRWDMAWVHRAKSRGEQRQE